MKTETRCYVTDAEGQVIINAAEFCDLLSKEHKGAVTHVMVKYYENFDKALTGEDCILKIFPIDRVFFKERSV